MRRLPKTSPTLSVLLIIPLTSKCDQVTALLAARQSNDRPGDILNINSLVQSPTRTRPEEIRCMACMPLSLDLFQSIYEERLLNVPCSDRNLETPYFLSL